VIDLNWSLSEKKAARRAFDAALQTAHARAMAEFKDRGQVKSGAS
jgi:hypothetical protein